MSDRLALLERAQQGDDRAEAQLLTENAGLIWSIVRRYNGCGVETDDLYQLGCIGFVKAVKGFDLTYGTQFSTYAVPKIAGEIRRFLRDDGPVKVGRTMREKGQTLWAARERLQGRLGCEPKLSQLAAETGMTPEEIAAVDLALIAPDSLQQETAEGLTLDDAEFRDQFSRESVLASDWYAARLDAKRAEDLAHQERSADHHGVRDRDLPAREEPREPGRVALAP